MSLEFPFEYADIEDLGRLFYPIIKAQLKTISGWREFEFLVDTGADITTVPTHLLPVLGFKINQLQRTSTVSVGGLSIKTWEFVTSLKLGDADILIHCNAVESKYDSMPLLLGRKDIFEERFNLLLNSREKITVISQNK